MSNHSDGMSFSVSRLSEDKPWTWINMRISDSPNDPYPGVFFDYYSRNRVIERKIGCYKDESGWGFLQEGPVQPFENEVYYRERLKKHRFNRAIVTEYMQKLGCDISASSFWNANGPAYLLWQKRSPSDTLKKYNPRNRPGLAETPPKARWY